MAQGKPGDQYPSTEDLARLPRAEQQRRLGGQVSAQPFGVSDASVTGPAQRTKTPQEMPALQQSAGRRQPNYPPIQQRTLTEEEKRQRQEAFQRAASQQSPAPPFEQAMAADDPSWTPQHVAQGMRQPDGGPHEGFERRMQRVLATPPPGAIDYDRDGHPDMGAGRSARMVQNFHSQASRAQQVAAAQPRQVDRNRDGYPDNAVPGPDGFRQDQIGYRARLVARREVMQDESVDQEDAESQPESVRDEPVQPEPVRDEPATVPTASSQVAPVESEPVSPAEPKPASKPAVTPLRPPQPQGRFTPHGESRPTPTESKPVAAEPKPAPTESKTEA
jgi:hypothetical protein